MPTSYTVNKISNLGLVGKDGKGGEASEIEVLHADDSTSESIIRNKVTGSLYAVTSARTPDGVLGTNVIDLKSASLADGDRYRAVTWKKEGETAATSSEATVAVSAALKAKITEMLGSRTADGKDTPPAGGDRTTVRGLESPVKGAAKTLADSAVATDSVYWKSRPWNPSLETSPQVKRVASEMLEKFGDEITWIYGGGKRAAGGTDAHSQGRAIDFLVGPLGKKADPAADATFQKMIGHVNANAEEWGVTEMLYGGKIWSKKVDGAPKPFDEWRDARHKEGTKHATEEQMNHFDHLHVTTAR